MNTAGGDGKTTALENHVHVSGAGEILVLSKVKRSDHSYRREKEARQSFDRHDKEVLTRALDIVLKFRKADPAISAHTIETLLRVALDEGYLGVKEYAHKADMATTVMARNLLDLGDRKRNMEPGMGLVEQYADPLDLRTTQTFLTHKGRALLRFVIEKMGR